MPSRGLSGGTCAASHFRSAGQSSCLLTAPSLLGLGARLGTGHECAPEPSICTVRIARVASACERRRIDMCPLGDALGTGLPTVYVWSPHRSGDVPLCCP